MVRYFAIRTLLSIGSNSSSFYYEDGAEVIVDPPRTVVIRDFVDHYEFGSRPLKKVAREKGISVVDLITYRLSRTFFEPYESHNFARIFLSIHNFYIFSDNIIELSH
jgi:hypothetical protein